MIHLERLCRYTAPEIRGLSLFQLPESVAGAIDPQEIEELNHGFQGMDHGHGLFHDVVAIGDEGAQAADMVGVQVGDERHDFFAFRVRRKIPYLAEGRLSAIQEKEALARQKIRVGILHYGIEGRPESQEFKFHIRSFPRSLDA